MADSIQLPPPERTPPADSIQLPFHQCAPAADSVESRRAHCGFKSTQTSPPVPALPSFRPDWVDCLQCSRYFDPIGSSAGGEWAVFDRIGSWAGDERAHFDSTESLAGRGRRFSTGFGCDGVTPCFFWLPRGCSRAPVRGVAGTRCAREECRARARARARARERTPITQADGGFGLGGLDHQRERRSSCTHTALWPLCDCG